ncbi:coiled-coil domain-containing protein 33-like [Clavelina lepadiformis]|uniref:coiled-coil domain-containing protein 33-like n=1 Tax=Clavelina lepadiformis TaxID=159417 RepID=UPI0040438E28
MSDRGKQVKLEEKVLDFIFEIAQVQFNKNGVYYLKISIQHGHRTDLLPQVLLEVNNSGNCVSQAAIKTDSVTWESKVDSVSFNQRRFRFILPKGFCKNDKNYDVYLLIEAYQDTQPTKRVGEALFAIYPRTESPRAKLNVKKGEDYYKYAGILTLLRPRSKASTSMHCGRLSYGVALREHVDSNRQAIYEDEDDEENMQTPELLPSPPPPAPTPQKERLPVVRESIVKPTLSPNTVKHRTALKNGKEQQMVKEVSKESTSNESLPFPFKEETVIISPELESEGSFHISIASTPPPDISPSGKQKTMDSPANEARPATKSTSPKKGRTSRRTSRSPTVTSPKPANKSDSSNRHVAKPGFEEIYVIIHGATSLPSRSDGADPIPFATVKSLYEEQGGRAAQGSTHASLSPTHSPAWEEVLTMEIPEGRVEEEEIVLTVADSVSKEKLVTYNLPIINLEPFHPYHFELVKPTKSIPSGIRVYVTVLRKQSHLPRLEDFGFCGLEVTLRDFQQELSNSSGSLIAIARIVPDYTSYKETMLTRYPCPAGITSTTLTFPSPNPSAFEVAKVDQQGYPQLTTISKETSRPTWNHTFMFCNKDAATTFAHNSALVVEFYPSSSTMTSVTWTIRSPIGFSTLLLDGEIFQALTSDAGRMGVRIDDLIVQGSRFETVDGSFPSIRLLLRLITTERPDTLVVASDPGVLPTLDSVPTTAAGPQRPAEMSNDIAQLYLSEPEEEIQPRIIARDDTAIGGPRYERKKTRVLMKEDEYPPSDALETILPDYVLTVNDPTMLKMDTTSRNVQPPQKSERSSDSHTKSLLDHHAQELSKYREAVKRMTADIVALRRSNAQLQEENAQLRRELLLTKEVGQTVMDDLHKGVITSTEVADKFVATRHKLAKESEDLSKYKTKVQLLQNQMIKANEREKRYLMQNASRKELEETVQYLQDKLKKSKKLEDTCVQQEKVIQKMEKLLNKYMKNTTAPPKNELGDQQGTITLLSQENANLQHELSELRIRQQQHNAEKTELHDRLERAESRVASLEGQLDHNARSWAKEKHELTVRLQEHRNGILRTSGANARNDPLLN